MKNIMTVQINGLTLMQKFKAPLYIRGMDDCLIKVSSTKDGPKFTVFVNKTLLRESNLTQEVFEAGLRKLRKSEASIIYS